VRPLRLLDRLVTRLAAGSLLAEVGPASGAIVVVDEAGFVVLGSGPAQGAGIGDERVPGHQPG
jgi:hypothetical protein